MIATKRGEDVAYKIGTKVRMTKDALENYGEEYRGNEFTVTRVATKYMPSGEFYAKGEPTGYHPGYDDAAGGLPLYDFEELEFSLYSWEVTC